MTGLDLAVLIGSLLTRTRFLTMRVYQWPGQAPGQAQGQTWSGPAMTVGAVVTEKTVVL
jgi:hypothetical protein